MSANRAPFLGRVSYVTEVAGRALTTEAAFQLALATEGGIAVIPPLLSPLILAARKARSSFAAADEAEKELEPTAH